MHSEEVQGRGWVLKRAGNVVLPREGVGKLVDAYLKSQRVNTARDRAVAIRLYAEQAIPSWEGLAVVVAAAAVDLGWSEIEGMEGSIEEQGESAMLYRREPQMPLLLAALRQHQYWQMQRTGCHLLCLTLNCSSRLSPSRWAWSSGA